MQYGQNHALWHNILVVHVLEDAFVVFIFHLFKYSQELATSFNLN